MRRPARSRWPAIRSTSARASSRFWNASCATSARPSAATSSSTRPGRSPSRSRRTRSMPMSTTCAPSWALPALSSRRSEGSATALPMTEPGPPAVGEDRVDRGARQSDARLVRGVRWRLVLFSGGRTLLILLALGALLYVRVASSLAATGITELDARAASLEQFLGGSDNPGNGPPTGLVFGGGSSGTFAVMVAADGSRIGDLDDGVPTGLPNQASVAAAWQTGRDVRDGML